MAIDAKMSFLGQVENGCGDILAKNDLGKMLKVISDVLERFDMVENRRVDDNRKDDLIETFLSSMQIQGRSKLTIDRYRRIIGIFMKYANTTTRQINVYHVRNWLANEKERGVQDSTLDGCRQVLSSCFGWLYRESLIDRNPMANIGVIKVAKKVKKIYTDIDLEKLNRKCKTVRDRAIIHFLASTGCRVSEMTGLNRDMIDPRSLECMVHGKGNKDRTVYMDAVTGMLISEYLKTRTDDNPALFIGQRKERLQPNGVRAMLNVLAKEAGVEHVHPHKFRRTLATELTRHGMPVQEVAAILGHENLDTTMQYVVLDRDGVRANYRKYA